MYVLALIFGWVALGTLIGERLVTTFNWTRLSPAVAAGLGTMLVELVSTLVGLVLCLGPMINIALALDWHGRGSLDSIRIAVVSTRHNKHGDAAVHTQPRFV